jgi:hypothetical protein
MRLTYTSPEENTIRVTLDEGESLDDLVGPIEAFVPTDEDNRHFATIRVEGLEIYRYAAPMVNDILGPRFR